MANVAKYTRAQIGGMIRHYERARKDNGEYQTFGNQDIDVSRIHLNYNLAPERDGGQLGFIRERTTLFVPTENEQERVSGVVGAHCLTRENINVMCSWVITLPKTFGEVCGVDEPGKLIYNYDEIDSKIFFREAYRFLNNRYANGSDKNVISSYVHLDETTPHMHYTFVPVVWDEKKGIEKVSAKAVINRFDLKSFHQDLEKHMSQVFGYEVGILNDATKDGNRSVEELKRGTAQAQLSEIYTEFSEINSKVSNLKSETFKLRDEVLIKAI